MSKQEFLNQLRKRLSGLPPADMEERLAFYSEMIDDRMEEGLSQEEAVSAVGTLDEIVAQIVADPPLTKIPVEQPKPKRRRSAGETLLLILGSPIWLSLGISAFAVVFSLYVSLWAVILSLWSVFITFAVCAVAGVLACILLFLCGNSAAGCLALLAAGFVCAGLAIFTFFLCKVVTKGTWMLTKKMAIWTKNRFVKKEAMA